MSKQLIILFSLLFILSCASRGNIGKESIPPEKISSDRIESFLDNGKAADAYQDLYWFVHGNKEEESQDNLMKAFTGRIEKEFQSDYDKALNEKNFVKAFRIMNSVRTAGIDVDFHGKSGNDLIKEIVFSDAGDHTKEARLYYARNYMNLELLEDDELIKLADIGAESGDKGFLELIQPELKKRGMPASDSVKTVLDKRYSSSQLIKGTVTIWVNRGMKIENGMGVPDRVIGSGFFIDSEGFILTNYHVISSEVDPEYEGYSRLYVKLSDNTREKIPAKVIGWDRIFDIALLKVDTAVETVFSFGREKEYEPGTSIIAIGSPGGLENTITSGIISAYGRKFLQLGTVMQVDVPINHGNSGGPLLDKENNLIGVVFAGIEQFEGINFAIPSRYIVKLIPELYGGGKIVHPFLGVSLYEKGNDVSVTYVMPGTSAARAGLQKGDILKELNGREIVSVEEVQRDLMDYKPGMIIKLVFERNGKREEGFFALSERPDFPAEEAYDKDATENLFLPLFGMDVDSVSTGILGNNFIITTILEGSIADESGLSVNDPFTVQRIKKDKEYNQLLMEIRIKRRKSGFLESGLMLSTYLETGDFI